MKRILFTSLSLCLICLTMSACSVMQGRPEKNNIEQAEGTSTWWNTRQDEQFNAQQLNDQFGDQPGDDNRSYTSQDAINTDAKHFDF